MSEQTKISSLILKIDGKEIECELKEPFFTNGIPRNLEVQLICNPYDGNCLIISL